MPFTNGARGLSSGLKDNSTKHTGGRTFIILSILSAVLLTVGVRLGETGPIAVVRGGFNTITMPIRVIGSAVTTPFQGVGNIFVNLTANQETLTQLREENEQLRSRNAELEEANTSVQRLQGLLDLQNTYNLKSTGARVISGSSDSWSSTITIDKGSISGLAVGMPVTDSSAAIGQIISVSPTSSTVRLITDEHSGVAAMVQSSRAQGILMGSASGQLTLNQVRTDQTVKVGDTIVASGLGGVFPKGLPLGKVTSVETNPGALYYTIVVEPIGHVTNNEEVMVITSLTEEQKATAEDIAEADTQNTGGNTSSGASSGSGSDGNDKNKSDSSSNSTSNDNTQTSLPAPSNTTQHNQTSRTD